jgi:5-methylcytosine-specific restriction endonuclease McrA
MEKKVSQEILERKKEKYALNTDFYLDQARNYYLKNKEKILAKRKENYYKDKKKIQAIQKRYVHKNILKIRAYHVAWSKNYYSQDINFEKRKSYLGKYLKNYVKTASGKMAIYRSNISRRVLKLKAKISGSHTKEEWLDLLKKSKGHCNLCGDFVGEEKLTKDHIIPLSNPFGSNDNISNIQPVCLSCNASKGGFRQPKALNNSNAHNIS